MQRLVDIGSALEWAIRITKPLISRHGRLVQTIGPLPPVLADETRLGQVFVNVLVNAAHALSARETPGDVGRSAPNEIRLDARTDDRGRAVIEIADNGCGMTAAVLERIFEPFFTTKGPGEGTGLGLSISHGIVKALGGSIDVSSALGVGTTFRITLPLPATPCIAPSDETEEAFVPVRKQA